MKNFCIVSFCNLYFLPYAKTYIKTIIESGSECTLLFWDRDAVNGTNDNFPKCRKLVYQKKKTAISSFSVKLEGYIGATRFFRKIIDEEHFDGIIFLQTHAAVACVDVLKKYTKKYIVDIRDWTLENYWWYRKLEKKCVNNSFATIISSPAYTRFLPAFNYIIAHNFTPFSEQEINQIAEKKKANVNEPVNISFVGTVRFIEMDKKILKLFANDERFSINYFGNGSDVLEQFATDNGIHNVIFHGSFAPEDTLKFYYQTDIINTLYGNHNYFLDYALSNKLYHAGQLHLPILVCPETYMEEITTKYKMGFVFDVSDNNAPDKLYKYYNNYNRQELASGCDEFISTVKSDNKRFYQTIKKFVVE